MTPTIHKIDGIRVSMNNNDHDPPHVHARQAGNEAVISIRGREVIKGKLPPKRLKVAHNWIEEHEQELLDMWDVRMEIGGIKPI